MTYSVYKIRDAESIKYLLSDGKPQCLSTLEKSEEGTLNSEHYQ